MIVPSRELMPLVRDALGRGQRVRMTVTGTSMWPFLRDGDVVELEPAGTLRVGDVVLVETARDGTAHYVLHRVVRVGEGTFFLRGDAQADAEGPFTSADVLGRVTAASRHGRVRALDRGVWRVAGRLWLGIHPLGRDLFRLARLPRMVGGRALRRLQRSQAWRAWTRRFCPDYVVQEATPRDLVAVDAWLHPDGTHAAPASEEHPAPRLTSYVAKQEEEILGLARLMRQVEGDSTDVDYWLYSLTVRVRYRGMGIAQALVRRVIDQARAEGASTLSLHVLQDNAPALSLYRKLGFAPAALPPPDSDPAADAEKLGRRRMLLVKRLH